MDDADHITRELLEAYALGALDQDERAAVAAHLQRCPDCATRVAELEEAAHSLPLALAAASPLQPPADLEERVLARVATPRPRGRARLWRPRLAAAVAGALVVAGFGVWNLQLSSALSEERSQRERLAQLIGRQEVVLEVVDSDRAVRRLLLPEQPRPTRPYGKLFTRSDLGQAVAMAARLPRPAEGRSYQLWLTTAGRARRVGTLDVNAQGFGLLVFTARPQPEYEEARVTLQRDEATQPAAPVLIWRAD